MNAHRPDESSVRRVTPVPPVPPPRPVELGEADDSLWWLSILIGVGLVALGVWMLANPFESAVVLAWLVGFSLIFSGGFELVALGGSGWTAWVGGGLLILGGLAVLTWPDITLWALAVVAGLAVLAASAVRIVAAVLRRDQPEWVADLVLGGLGAVLGLLILAWPEATVVVLAIVFGLRAILTGLFVVAAGWRLHHLTA